MPELDTGAAPPLHHTPSPSFSPGAPWAIPGRRAASAAGWRPHCTLLPAPGGRGAPFGRAVTAAGTRRPAGARRGGAAAGTSSRDRAALPVAAVGSRDARQKHGWAGLATADAPGAGRCDRREAPREAWGKQEALRAGGEEAGFDLRPQRGPKVSLTDLLHPAAERSPAAGQQGTLVAARAAAASQAAAGDSRGHVRPLRQPSMVQFATDSLPADTDEPGQGPSSNFEGSDLSKRGRALSFSLDSSGADGLTPLGESEDPNEGKLYCVHPRAKQRKGSILKQASGIPLTKEFVLDSSGADAFTHLGEPEDPNEGKLYCVHPRARQRRGGILKQASGIPLMKGSKGSRTSFPDLEQPGAESSAHQTQRLPSSAQAAADASQAPTATASPQPGCETPAADKSIQADTVDELQLLPSSCTPPVAAAGVPPYEVTDTPLLAAKKIPSSVAMSAPVIGLTQPEPPPGAPDAAADFVELEARAGMQRAGSASSSMGDRMDAMWRNWRHTT